jgi:hypothetical protein
MDRSKARSLAVSVLHRGRQDVRMTRPDPALARLPSLPTSRRQMLEEVLAGAGALALSSVGCATAASLSPAPAPSGLVLPTGDVHDFDFFIGSWNLVNRRLKQRWVGSDDWDVFPASLRCDSHMGGVVNTEDVTFPTKGWSGMTLRCFHLEKRRWSLYWVNSRTGELFPPVVGGFTGDHGQFYGDDTDEGRAVKVRYQWTRLGPDTSHWEQAFSLDGTKWETNWIIDHTRARAT